MQQPVSKPSVCKTSLSQVSSSHAKGTSNGSLLKYDLILLVDIQNLIESRKKHPPNVLICYQTTRTCRAGEGVGGVTPPSSPSSPSSILQLFWNLSVFWQDVLVKFPDPMLSVNLEYIMIKNKIQNSINIQCRRNQTFTAMTALKEVI